MGLAYHPYDAELCIAGSPGDRGCLFEIEGGSLPLLSIIRRQDEKVRVRFFRMRADWNCPKRAASRADPRVEIVVIAQHDGTSIGSVVRWLRMFPNHGFDFIEAGRKG